MEAPTTSIETVTVVRPLKVIALLCLVIAVILLVVCLGATTWLRTGGFHQGLFEECQDKSSIARLRMSPDPGTCHTVQSRGGRVYIHAVAAMLVIAGILTVAAVVLTTVGLKTDNASRKYLFYRCALYIALLAVLLEAISLVTFPVCFYLELKDEDVSVKWDFDWAYGVCWGALVFTVGGALLLICDKEHEEIYYKEKTIMHPSMGKQASA